MFNFLRRVRRWFRRSRTQQPEVVTPDLVAPAGMVPGQIEPAGAEMAVAANPPMVIEPVPVRNIAPVALPVVWTPPTGAPTRKWLRLRRLDDADMIRASARLAAQGFYRGNQLSEPGFASLHVSTIADLTTAYLADYRIVGPQIAQDVARAALAEAESDLALTQRRHSTLVNNRPALPDTDPEAQARWVAGGHALRAIHQAEARLAAANTAHNAANRRLNIAATEAARALGAAARQGATRLRNYHEAFNSARQAAGHVALDGLPDDLDEQLTVAVIQAARRAMHPVAAEAY